ncbi:hypothetical protein VTN77DRAFT_3026 [Rasamsonia byssochlamydoides]|uniref:uncharacterized protein n=1 Tax=Rasamsonia byssochlamydoides TaxID=89139 RepID=UPI003743834D
MESITQEKKKLRSVISFEAKAPPGYTFIPAGNPQFTSACKEMCRKDGLKVFAVTTTPHQRMHDLSQQVHRIGYHFPSAVVATVCMELGLYLTSSGKAVSFEDLGNRPSSRRADSEVSQTTINTEARDVIRDLFPNIPEKDLDQIIKTAFQKGQKKVGTAVELPLARRAQLAVVAHIRHVYTDYDRLLKITSFQEARSLVEEPTLEKLVEWRGDDENGKTELEDVFREVIVISDDEDDDDSAPDHTNGPTAADRDSSVEIISSNTLGGELQTKPVNYATFSKEAFQDLSDDEAPPGFRFVPGVPPRDKVNKARVDRRGFSRYEAWDRARDRYRERISISDQTHFPGTRVDYIPGSYTSQQLLYDTVNSSSESMRDRQVAPQRPVPNSAFDSLNLGRVAPSDDRVHRPESVVRRNMEITYPSRFPPRQPPDVLRFPDGSIFEKIPDPIGEEAVPRSTNHSGSPVFVSGPSPSLRGRENPRKRMHPPENLPVRQDKVDISPQGHIVLPSIEVPESPPSPRQLADHRTSQTHRSLSEFQGYSQTHLRRPVEDLSRRINVIEVTDNRNESSKRRRLEYDEPPYDLSHHQSSPRDGPQPIFPQTFERPERQHIPMVAHGIQPGTGRNDHQFYRMQAIPLERQQTTRRPPERIPVRELSPVPLMQSDSGVFRPMTQAFSHHSEAPVFLDSSQRTVGSIRRSPIHSRFASLSHSRSYPVRDDGYVAEPGNVPNVSDTQPLYVSSGRDIPAVYGPAREIGPDASAWRSKASLYESERRHIYSQESSWPVDTRSHEHRPLRASQPPPRDRDIEDIFSPRRYVSKATDYSRDGGSLKMDFDFHQYPPPPPHQSRAKSQVPAGSLNGVDSTNQHGSYLNRNKETLPPSAVRRYEVQLGKALDPIRYASNPRRVLQEPEQSSHATPKREDQSLPYRHQPAGETIIID